MRRISSMGRTVCREITINIIYCNSRAGGEANVQVAKDKGFCVVGFTRVLRCKDHRPLAGFKLSPWRGRVGR